MGMRLPGGWLSGTFQCRPPLLPWTIVSFGTRTSLTRCSYVSSRCGGSVLAWLSLVGRDALSPCAAGPLGWASQYRGLRAPGVQLLGPWSLLRPWHRAANGMGRADAPLLLTAPGRRVLALQRPRSRGYWTSLRQGRHRLPAGLVEPGSRPPGRGAQCADFLLTFALDMMMGRRGDHLRRAGAQGLLLEWARWEPP